jgi:hypothetical protein
LAKEEVQHDVWKVISVVSFYQSSLFLSMSCKPFFLCHVGVVYVCHVDKLSIYVTWTSCLSMSCGQIILLCHVHKLLIFHFDKLFIYIMYTTCCSYLAMMMMTLMKRMRIFFKRSMLVLCWDKHMLTCLLKKSSKNVYNKWNGVYVGAIQHSRRMP